MRRSVQLSDNPSLDFEVGADAGCTWHLAVYVNNDKLLDRLIEGEPFVQGDPPPPRHWDNVHLDLAAYRKQPVVIRLYDLVLVPHHYVGNSYWRHIRVQ